MRHVAEAPTPGDDSQVTPTIADGWRAILLRRPRWRAEAEIRVEYDDAGAPAPELAALGEVRPGEIAIDLAVVDARPVDPAVSPPTLSIEPRAGGEPIASTGR